MKKKMVMTAHYDRTPMEVRVSNVIGDSVTEFLTALGFVRALRNGIRVDDELFAWCKGEREAEFDKRVKVARGGLELIMGAEDFSFTFTASSSM